MEVNLYKTIRGWAVKAGSEVESYGTIEQAADALLGIGIKDDAIDSAIIEMYANKHTRANFGINGGFIFSDEAQLDELLGVA
jgi:hypothetical protein